jgi:hypothetical protein
LWNQSTNDVTQNLWVLDINGRIVVIAKRPPNELNS